MAGCIYTLSFLGNVTRERGDYARAEQFYEASQTLAREVGDKWSLATNLYQIGRIMYFRASYQRAEALFKESLALYRELRAPWGYSLALRELAGDWAPAVGQLKADAIARKIARDSWAAWWKNTNGPALLAEFRKRTLGAEDRKKIQALIDKLGANQFAVRERASADLVAFGHQLRCPKDGAEMSATCRHISGSVQLSRRPAVATTRAVCPAPSCNRTRKLDTSSTTWKLVRT